MQRDRPQAEMLLVRHSCTAWNGERRRLGWANPPLTDSGRRLALDWAAPRPLRFAAVASSDLARARETAAIIASALGVSCHEIVSGLREQHQGLWTGLTKEQIKQRWPERMRERPRRPVGGESADAVLRRALGALSYIAEKHPAGPVLVVTHSEVIRIIERATGADAPPVPYLEGRWVCVSAARDPELRAVAAGKMTGGRLSSARPANEGHVPTGVR